MATRVAWLLNLGAEAELEDPRRDAWSPALASQIADFRARMTALLAPDDRVIDVDDDVRACDLALAFCPTPRALGRIAAAGLVPPAAPPLAVLARVNGRGFCAALGQTLPGATHVRSLPDLLAAIAGDAPDGWLLKRDLSFAGRERRRVQDGTLDASTEGFARRSFARGQGLQVEPWLERTADFAQHGYVLPSGRVLLGAPLAQHCDARGVWQSSGPLADDALSAHERDLLARSVADAGRALVAAGYFGPYGIDAFRYRARDGSLRFQPRSELNARFSMGYPRALLEHALGVAGAAALITEPST
jgi:hypothetical protein